MFYAKAISDFNLGYVFEKTELDYWSLNLFDSLLFQ